eukprot:TRINITY_DN17951_c0_g1_i1.p1 TRINITY_DN17951_c0_g1~~TRINITY_DN17951_c0_g1_i1.p1  ORF type:complete len:302 (+),score=20.83 TRINITY_DN17951_c0_g1_i1:92-997(+)
MIASDSVISLLQSLGIAAYVCMMLFSIIFLIFAFKSQRSSKTNVNNRKKIAMLSLNTLALAGQIPWFIYVMPTFIDNQRIPVLMDSVAFWLVTAYITPIHMAEMSYMLFGWIEAVSYIQNPSLTVGSHPYKLVVVCGTVTLSVLIAAAGLIVMVAIEPFEHALALSRFVLIPCLLQSIGLAVAFIYYGAKLRSLVASKLGSNSTALRYSMLLRRLHKLNIVLLCCIFTIIIYYSLITVVMVIPSTPSTKVAIAPMFLLPCTFVSVSILWFFHPFEGVNKDESSATQPDKKDSHSTATAERR